MSNKLTPEPDNNQEYTGSDNPDDTTISNKKIGPFTSLRFQNFRLLFVGTLLSNAALWIQQVTINWIVYNLTGSGAILGTINLVRSGAALSMIPASGVLIDRINHRKLMLILAGWLFIITGILGFVLLAGNVKIAYLFVFSCLFGLAQSIDEPLRQVMIFNLVPRSITPNAIAVIQTGWSLMRSFGPGIGGFLILWFGPSGNFFIQAVAYILIIVNIFFIQFPPRQIRTYGIRYYKTYLRVYSMYQRKD
jgi:MFS family permease